MKDERIEQAKIIRENWKEYSPGDTVNLISTTWLKSWKSYVKYEDSPILSSKSTPVVIEQEDNPSGNGFSEDTGKSGLSSSKSIQFDTPKPESIDNRELVEGKDSEGDIILKKNISEIEDYEIIPNNIWSLLSGWYPGDGPEIKRKVIELGLKNEKYVEVRPIILNCKFHASFLSEINQQTQPQAQQQQNNGSNSTSNTPQQTPTHTPTSPTVQSTTATPTPSQNSNKSYSHSNSNIDVIFQKSRKSTLNDFRDQLVKRYSNLDPNKIVFFNETLDPQKPKELKKYLLSLEDLKLEIDTQLKIHYQNELHPSSKLSKISKKFTSMFKKDKEKKSSHSGHSNSISSNNISSNGTNQNSNGLENLEHSTNGHHEKDGLKEVVMHKGVCGLNNLGNTCFMNSSIQCLAHTIPLVEYFLSNKYISDINKTNPLGMKGQIAEIYGKLMKEMWSGSSVVAPKNLKWIIGKYAPQFSGLSQQDSQELLSFLLDGLHEDLNKITKKPYTEDKPEPKEQRDDIVVANEQWENHLKRNLSVVVNLFQGQYKSTLICAKCSKISITFDPFMFVPLPIPIPTEIVFDVLLFRCKNIEPIGPDPKGIFCLNQSMAPVRFCVKLSKIDTVETLRLELFKLTNIDSACIALAETAKNRIQSFLNDQKYLAHVRDRDLITAYELPSAGDDVSRIHVMHRYKNELLLLPYVLILKYTEVTCKDLYRMVWERVGHRVKKGWKQILKQKLSSQQINSNNSNNNTPTLSTKDHQNNTTASNGINNENNINNDSNTTVTNISSPEESSLYDEDDSSSSIEDSFETIYPFQLKTTNGYGSHCDRCDQGCSGCVVECDDRYLNQIYKTSKFWREGCNNIVIDWRPEVIKFFEYVDETNNPQYTIQDKTTSIKAEMRSEITLNDCFSIFTKSEKLGPNDTWYCPQCKTHIEGSTKKLELWSAPRILVINLKRFSYLSHRHEKIGAYVDFPIDHLDLSKWVLNKNGPPPIYQLYAISNHMGGVGSGHYTACVKNRDQWFYISDSSYHSIDKSKIKSNEAYVLFYELKSQPLPNSSTPIITTTN